MTLLPPPTDTQRLGVFKFASCDGCQLSLLSCEDELLELADTIEIAYFLELSSRIGPGPFDIALVEGSISTKQDAQRIREIRNQSRIMVTIGACATSGGIQALRGWGDHAEFNRCVYAHPEYIRTLAKSTPVAAHVPVDFELRGCPIDRSQLLSVISDLIAHRRPRLPSHSVCMECKIGGIVCIAVTGNQPCLGAVTQAGCGAICPAYDRACYGCFGPVEQANCEPLSQRYIQSNISSETLMRAYRNMNAGARLFQIESDRLQNLEPSEVKTPE